MWLSGSLLACTFASPYIGREPKVGVTTEGMENYIIIFLILMFKAYKQ